MTYLAFIFVTTMILLGDIGNDHQAMTDMCVPRLEQQIERGEIVTKEDYKLQKKSCKMDWKAEKRANIQKSRGGLEDKLS